MYGIRPSCRTRIRFLAIVVTIYFDRLIEVRYNYIFVRYLTWYSSQDGSSIEFLGSSSNEAHSKRVMPKEKVSAFVRSLSTL